MTDNDFKNKFPAFYYSPDGKDSKLVDHPDDIPEGWFDSPYVEKRGEPKSEKKASKPKASKDEGSTDPDAQSPLDALKEFTGEDEISRGDIKEALTERDVQFKGNAKTDDLAALLLKELENDDSSNDN